MRLLSLFLLLLAADVHAQGIAVSPGSLSFDGSPQSITIFNQNEKDIEVRLSSVGYPFWYRFSKERMLIKAGSKERIELNIFPDEAGEFKDYISISSEEGLLGMGLFVPVIIKSSKGRVPNLFLGILISFIIVLVGLISYFLLTKLINWRSEPG